MTGLVVLWFATKTLALRRESKPNDPLGIGPCSEKFSSNIADCCILLTLSCLGLIMPWHELGKTGLNFMLQATAFYAVVIAPEKPKKAGAIFGATASLLLLCSGVGSFLAIYLAIFIICFRSYPWILVGKTFLKYSLLFSVVIVSPLIFSKFSEESLRLLNLWWGHQMSFGKIEPLFLLKTWLWTWWPLWPIVTAFCIQAYTRGFLSLSHLKMPLIFLFSLALFPLAGIFISDGTKFIPIVPLAVLAAFGLLSLPRNIASLIDYFALSIFSFLGIMIWVYWIALHTGTPETIHHNVLKAAPGISGAYSLKDLMIGITVTLAWFMLIGWRVRVSAPMLWRPVILSAGGLSMTWILLVNLWGPALEINRGYSELTIRINKAIKNYHQNPQDFCIEIDSNDFKSRAIILSNTNFRINMSNEKKSLDCDFLFVRKTILTNSIEPRITGIDNINWKLTWSGHHMSDPKKKEKFFLYKKI